MFLQGSSEDDTLSNEKSEEGKSERDLSSPELFADEEETKKQVQVKEETKKQVQVKEEEETRKQVQVKDEEETESGVSKDFEARLEEDLKDEVKRHHSPEQLGSFQFSQHLLIFNSLFIIIP